MCLDSVITTKVNDMGNKSEGEMMFKANPEKRKIVLVYILVIACEVLVALISTKTFVNRISLEFYSNAYNTADCESVQLYYSYGEEFSEDNSIVTSSLTDQNNGYSIDLSDMDIKNAQTIRMDFFLRTDQKVSVDGFALKVKASEIKRIDIDDDRWNNCIFINDMEYLGNNEFITTGDDPYIIFGQDVALELREGYITFYYKAMLVCVLMLIMIIALQVAFRVKIVEVIRKAYNGLKFKIVNMRRNEIIVYTVAVICNLFIIAICVWFIKGEFSLNVYSNAYGSAYSDKLQMYYSYGEEFSEDNSIITSKQTKLKDGYVVKLLKAKVKDVQSIRIDYFLQEGQRVEIQRLELRFGKIILNRVGLNDDVWCDCVFNDIEYLGKGVFEITGEDPYIIFDAVIAKEIREPYRVFNNRIRMVIFVAFGVLIFLEIFLRNRIKIFWIQIYRLIDRKKAVLVMLVATCDLLLIFMGKGLVENGFSLAFYTDAYYAANGNRVQLYYSVGQEFDEGHTMITNTMTKFKDGFLMNLSNVDVRELQAVRMDYFLETERRIEAQGFALKFAGITIEKVDFNDEIWNNCFYNDMEHLGNGKFKITGEDPHIVFDKAIAKELQQAYQVFYNGVVVILVLVIFLIIALEIFYRNQMGMFLEDKYTKIKVGILNMHIELYFNDILKLYDTLYPIVIIIIGLNLEKKGYDFQINTDLKWNIIKVILFFSFALWIKIRFFLGRKKEKGFE